MHVSILLKCKYLCPQLPIVTPQVQAQPRDQVRLHSSMYQKDRVLAAEQGKQAGGYSPTNQQRAFMALFMSGGTPAEGSCKTSPVGTSLAKSSSVALVGDGPTTIELCIGGQLPPRWAQTSGTQDGDGPR